MSKNISLFYLDILNVLIKIACQSLQSCQTLCNPLDNSPPGCSVHGIFSGKNIGVGCHFLTPGYLPEPIIKPTSPVSPALQADSLPAEPSGKPKMQSS